MRLLDLFCCEGVGARGYIAAGFDVTGVDVEPRFAKRYPGRFVHADALAYVREHGHEYDVIHASPPCQAYSITRHTHNASHPDLIDATREALRATGKPYVIENVPGAPLIEPLTLCGSMFELDADDDDGTYLVLRRHRLFESNMALHAPGPCDHAPGVQVAGAYGAGTADKWKARHVRHGGYTPAKHVREALLGVPPGAHTLHGLSQSIPPAYTRWIGSLILSGDGTLDPVSTTPNPHERSVPMSKTQPAEAEQVTTEAPAALAFDDVDVPAPKPTGRQAEPNPFADKVNQLAREWADGRSAKASRFTIPAEQVKSRKRQIQAAAAAVGKSARVTVDVDENGPAVVTFWLVDKITRTSATAAPSPAE